MRSALACIWVAYVGSRSPLSVFAVHAWWCHGVILTARLSVSLRAVNGKCARVISSHPAASLVIRRRFASFNSRHDDGRPLLLMATRNAQLGVRTQVRKIFELNLLSKQTNESTAIVLCSVGRLMPRTLPITSLLLFEEIQPAHTAVEWRFSFILDVECAAHIMSCAPTRFKDAQE